MKTKNIMKSIVTIIALSSQAHAGTVGGTGGALEITQNIQTFSDIGDRALAYTSQLQQYSTQLIQYQQQVQQYANQFLSYKMMLQNIGTLPQAQWEQFTNQVMQLKNALEYGQSVSYTAANFENKFITTFKGYDKYFEMAMADKPNFLPEYKNMYISTNDTVKGALKSLGLQEQDLQNDEAIMAQLKVQSETSVGQLSAVQAASQIALHQTTQLKKASKDNHVPSQCSSHLDSDSE
ncbi:MAG: hypothetical protein Q9M36_08360 [Sulfurovum sp.]|nr:hypothetical protein [Sulfurovum sp.]